MEDHFLYKLRNGQLQNNKGNYRTKKINEHKRDGNISSDVQRQFGRLLEKVLDLQKKTLACLETFAVCQDRQSETMARIAEALKTLNEPKITKSGEVKINKESGFLSESSFRGEDYVEKMKPLKKGSVEKGLNSIAEEELFETVKSMREEDYTWNTVAGYLKRENIPTLTGNGTWSPNLARYFYKKMLSQVSNA